jgi:hypothetical protein
MVGVGRLGRCKLVERSRWAAGHAWGCYGAGAKRGSALGGVVLGVLGLAGWTAELR